MAPLTDPRAQVLANCRILYGEAPIEILTLFTREFEDPIYQAVAMRYNETDGSWTKMLHKTFKGNNLVDLMYSLLYETEIELARRFSALGIALPLTGEEMTVNFTREERRGSVASISSRGSRSSSRSATSTFEFIPTPRSGSPETDEPDNAAVEAGPEAEVEAEAAVDDATAGSNDPIHDDEAWVDTDEELQHDGEPVEEPTVVIERRDEGLVETVEEALIEEVPVEEMACEEAVEASPQPEPVSEPESLPQLESLPVPEPLPVPESVPEPKPLSEAEVVSAHDIVYTSTAAPQSYDPHEWLSSTTRKPSQKNVTFNDIVFQENHIGKGKERETSLLEAYTRHPGEWLEWNPPKDKDQVSGPSSARFAYAEDEPAESEPAPVEYDTNWNNWGSSKKYRKKQLQVVTEKEAVPEPEPEPKPPADDDPWAVWCQSSSSRKDKKKKKPMALESAATSSEPKAVSSTGEFDWGSWGTIGAKGKSKIPIRKEISPAHGSCPQTENNDIWNFTTEKGKGKRTSAVREEMSPEIGSPSRTENGDISSEIGSSTRAENGDMSPEIGSSSRTENGDFWNFASDNGKQRSHQPFDSHKFHQAAYPTTEPEPDVWDTLIKRDKKGKSRARTHETNPGQCSATVTEFNWDFTKSTSSTAGSDNLTAAARTSAQQHLHHEYPLNAIPFPSKRPTESHYPQRSVTYRTETQEPRDKESSQHWLYGFKTSGKPASDGDTWPSIIPMARSVVRDDGIDDDWGTFATKKSKKGKNKASVSEWDD